MRELEQGDVADILQMVRWQRELYAKVPQLEKLNSQRQVEMRSQQFIQAFGLHKVTAADYPSSRNCSPLSRKQERPLSRQG